MNIFYLDTDVRWVAEWHCDKHVPKMIVETAQMLSTAHHTSAPLIDTRLYKPAYLNHPCTKWVREVSGNYEWLYKLFLKLIDEFNYRFVKQHACERLVEPLAVTPSLIPVADRSKVALAMPPQYKAADPVKAYRNYYQSKQLQFEMTWRGRRVPPWFKLGLSTHSNQ